MPSSKHIRDFSIFYMACSVAGFLWFLWHHLTLSQQAPVFFLNKPDISGNILLATGIADKVITSSSTRLLLDGIFFLLPFFLVIAVHYGSRWLAVVSIFTGLYNMAYAYLFSIFTFVSIEVFTAWIFVPFVFASSGIRTQYYLLHCVRLIFLVIFFSTALWKLKSGGLFNPEQLSAVLFRQHASLLITNTGNWFSGILLYLISHSVLSYTLYLLAFALECIFMIGFFTRRFDRLLIVCFLSFLVFDYVLMEINYFPWLPFLGTLYYSRYPEPGGNGGKASTASSSFLQMR